VQPFSSFSFFFYIFLVHTIFLILVLYFLLNFCRTISISLIDLPTVVWVFNFLIFYSFE
jgi:hypothetical protein